MSGRFIIKNVICQNSSTKTCHEASSARLVTWYYSSVRQNIFYGNVSLDRQSTIVYIKLLVTQNVLNHELKHELFVNKEPIITLITQKQVKKLIAIWKKHQHDNAPF